MSGALSRSSSFLLLPVALLASGRDKFEENGSDCEGVSESTKTRSSPMSAVPCGGLSLKRASLPCCDVVAGRLMLVSVVGVVMSINYVRLPVVVDLSHSHLPGSEWLSARSRFRCSLPFFSLSSSSVSF